MANERWILAPGQRVTFARFMELALYHPQLGYYARPRGAYPAGPEGDFVTAPTAHPLFAALWAEILAALRERRGQPLTFADLGAGDGRFLRNLAGFLDAQTVARLMAVEVSPAGREAMAASLPQVELAASLAELSPSEGPCVIFASELYDALPCHLLEGTEGGLCELYVEASEDGTLRLVADNPSTPELSAYLAAYGITLEAGQRAEVRLEARRFHQQVLAWAGSDAVVFVLDYGYPARSLYNPRARRGGSLTGYRQHRVVTDLLSHPGEVDITAHVNWDDLLAAGNDLGFGARPVEPLGLFLTRWGILELAGAGGKETSLPWEVRLLVHPAGMGSDLKVLVQGKGALWECWQELDGQRRP
ncbi:MAG: SAM-dependent methyltransferase [Thermoanaerobaculum sp.]|nr:MAG: SAM-dependent methyltransferase [Thermoanaerobaculum sp.]